MPAERVALVTGGAGGIGRHIVAALKDGGQVVVATDLPSDPQVRGAAGYLPADVTDPDAIGAVVERVMAEHGRLDVVVAAAGVASQTGILDVEPKELERVLAVNVKGAFYTVQAAYRAMTSRSGGGRIVVLSSLAASVGGVFAGPHYCASKGAVEGLVRSVARTGAAHGVLVNAVAPGVTDSPMTADFGWRDDQFPLGRVGHPSDVAGAVAYLCSDAASYVTGITLHVNGGTYFG